MSKAVLTFAVYQGETLLRRETVAHDIVKVGKDPKSHLRIDDDAASRMHAVVEVTGPGEIQLIDLGSTRGTTVNGERINKAVLRSGDQVHFGDTRVVVSFGVEAAPAGYAPEATPAPAAAPQPEPVVQAFPGTVAYGAGQPLAQPPAPQFAPPPQQQYAPKSDRSHVVL